MVRKPGDDKLVFCRQFSLQRNLTGVDENNTRTHRLVSFHQCYPTCNLVAVTEIHTGYRTGVPEAEVTLLCFVVIFTPE